MPCLCNIIKRVWRAQSNCLLQVVMILQRRFQLIVFGILVTIVKNPANQEAILTLPNTENNATF